MLRDNNIEGGLVGLTNTLKNMQSSLESWGSTKLGNFKHKLSTLRKMLDKVRKASLGWGLSEEESTIMAQISVRLHQEEAWIK
jgi:hypothetical protein